MEMPKKEKQIIGLEIDFTCPYCCKEIKGFDLNANAIDIKGCGSCGGGIRYAITCPLCNYKIEFTGS